MTAAVAVRGHAGSGHGEPVIRTRKLTKKYGDIVAVDRLDLEVQPGEVFGLLGPNGAGKTTTVLMLLGLSEPTSGEARVLGLDPNRDPLEIKRQVGYMPDSVGFYEDLTGRQNLRYTARLNRLPDREAEVRIGTLLDQVGLADAADRKTGTYSRGMLQRLGVADALVKSPSVLILDEPTVSIDPQGVAEMLDLIGRIAGEEGIAILLSSHLLDQVQSVCTRVGIFVGGRMIASGTVAELAAATAGSANEEAIEVGIAGDHQKAEATIRAIPGVRRVEAEPDAPERFVVTGDPALAETLAAQLVAAGLTIDHFRRRSERLDAIYRRLVTRANDPDAPRRSGSGGGIAAKGAARRARRRDGGTGR